MEAFLKKGIPTTPGLQPGFGGLGLGVAHLGHETLEEARHALLLGHVGQNPEAALRVVEVPVLDTGLDDVQRRRDDERGRRTGDGGDEVLEPRGLVVVLELEEIFLGEGRATEELPRVLVVFTRRR